MCVPREQQQQGTNTLETLILRNVDMDRRGCTALVKISGLDLAVVVVVVLQKSQYLFKYVMANSV